MKLFKKSTKEKQKELEEKQKKLEENKKESLKNLQESIEDFISFTEEEKKEKKEKEEKEDYFKLSIERQKTKMDNLEILKNNLYDYLNYNRLDISILNDWKKLTDTIITDDKIINNNFIDISLILKFVKFYDNYINKEIKYKFLQINNEIYDYLVKSILYYYEYYYYYYNVTSFINDNILNSKTDEDKIKLLMEQLFEEYTTNCEDINKQNKNKLKPPTNSYNFKLKFFNFHKYNKGDTNEKNYYEIYYRYILYTFLKKIKYYNYNDYDNLSEDIIRQLLYKPSIQYEEKTSINLFTININNFISNIRYIYIDYIGYDEYITLPQYEAICWFIAFLTSISYSDNSKKLFIKKFNIDNITNITDISTETNPTNILKSFIYYIISNITLNFEKYNDYKSFSSKSSFTCDLGIFLKDIPIYFLLTLYKNNIDYIKTTYSQYFLNEEFNYDIIFKDLNDFKLSFLLYFYNINNKSDNLNHDSELGLNTNYNICFTYFYDLLNIGSIYLVLFKNNLYQPKYINIDVPDVILIDKPGNKEQYNYKNMVKSESKMIDISTIGDDEITYKGQKYVLDYIMVDGYIIENKKHGEHAISIIKYNNKVYYYDQKNIINSIDFYDCYNNNNNYKIRIPCPLVLTKDEQFPKRSDNITYCLNHCYYKELDISDNITKNTHKASTDNLCYTTKSGYIYGYVKKPDDLLL
jgi:hypothetical protein